VLLTRLARCLGGSGRTSSADRRRDVIHYLDADGFDSLRACTPSRHAVRRGNAHGSSVTSTPVIGPADLAARSSIPRSSVPRAGTGVAGSSASSSATAGCNVVRREPATVAASARTGPWEVARRSEMSKDHSRARLYRMLRCMQLIVSVDRGSTPVLRRRTDATGAPTSHDTTASLLSSA
jgi:hypothetical protein